MIHARVGIETAPGEYYYVDLSLRPDLREALKRQVDDDGKPVAPKPDLLTLLVMSAFWTAYIEARARGWEPS